MKISSIIKERISQNDIQEYFFNKGVIEILYSLSSEISKDPFQLREIILSNFTPDTMLRSKKLRNLLLESLYESEAVKLLEALDINKLEQNDPYKLLLKMRFSKNSKHEKILFNFFEENPPLVEKNITESTRKSVEHIDTNFPMFKHQRRAITEIKKFLSSSKRKCLLHMPTGSGKTVTAMRVVTSLFLNSNPIMVVWLAYNEELCEQAIEEFKKIWGGMGDRSVNLLRYFGSYSCDILTQTAQGKECIIFASLAKLNLAEQQGNAFLSTLSDRVDMVVMDEAHQATAPTYMNILQQLVEKRIGTTQLLGLSATPGRTSTSFQESIKLAKFFNHKKVTLEIEDYKNPLDYLIKKEYLAKPNPIPIRADGNLNAEDLKRIAKDSIDIPEDILIKMGKNALRTLKIINEIKKLINSGHKRIIVFGSSVENSRDISIILTVLGHTSFHVDLDTTLESRRTSIEEYKSDSTKAIIMCNYGVFTTGFDAPRTSAVVIARPTKSVILYSQMVGRAMRGKKVGGNKTCEIRIITDVNLPQFTRLVEGFFNWEDAW